MRRFDNFSAVTLEQLEKLALFRLADAMLFEHLDGVLASEITPGRAGGFIV